MQIRYDETLAHKIEAGSDMFLMPSRYEPCGLNQIYSLKYGTVPIVRATGGLDDTIEEWDAKKGTGTGFKFAGFDSKDLLAEIDRAIDAFHDKAGWTRLMRNGMARDYSWSGPAKEYVRVYEEAAQGQVKAGLRLFLLACEFLVGPIFLGGSGCKFVGWLSVVCWDWVRSGRGADGRRGERAGSRNDRHAGLCP